MVIGLLLADRLCAGEAEIEFGVEFVSESEFESDEAGDTELTNDDGDLPPVYECAVQNLTHSAEPERVLRESVELVDEEDERWGVEYGLQQYDTQSASGEDAGEAAAVGGGGDGKGGEAARKGDMPTGTRGRM